MFGNPTSVGNPTFGTNTQNALPYIPADFSEFTAGAAPPEPVSVGWQWAGASQGDSHLWYVINPFTDFMHELWSATQPYPQVFYPPTAATGGFFDSPYVGGEAGGEWAVPTTEPYSSNFLRDVGADPEVTGTAIANRLAPLIAQANDSGGGGNIHVHVHVDGNEIGSVVASQADSNTDMMNSIRRNIDIN